MNIRTQRQLSLEVHFGGRQITCFAERPTSLTQLFNAAITRGADRPALIDERETISYRELDSRAARVAYELAQRGLTAGDRVVLLTGNTAGFGVVALACWRRGLVIVPLNPRNVREEVAYVLNQCQARALVLEASLADRAPASGQAPACAHVLDLESLLSGSAANHWPTPSPSGNTGWTLSHQAREEDVAVLLYTSGTTGRPKGAMLTHLNIIHSVLHFVDAMNLREGEECSLLAVPISHVTGLVAIWLAMVAVNGSVVMMREFKAGPCLALLSRYRVTHTVLVPAIYNLLLRDPDFEHYDLSALRSGGYGGAPMPEPTIEALAAKLPALGLMNAYGATETTSPATLMPASEQRAHLDSVGRVLPCARIRVMDDDGREVARGETGELWIAGPMVVPGYWDNPEATAREFVDGYWKSGDLGSIDTEGYVRVFDRKKDMINRGGYKVYGAEVESVLVSHVDVLEACVVGLPDPVLGERTRAIIVARPDAVIDAESIRSHCAARLADYKVPDFVEFRAEPLPRNPNGKVLKRALR